MADEGPDPTWWMDARFTGALEARAGDLRLIADAIDRLAHRGPHRHPDGSLSWQPVVTDLLHTVSWGVANLNLDALVQRAHDIDRLRPPLPLPTQGAASR